MEVEAGKNNFIFYKSVYFEDEYLLCLKYFKNENYTYITCNKDLSIKYNILYSHDYLNLNRYINSYTNMIHICKELINNQKYIGFCTSRMQIDLNILKNNCILYAYKEIKNYKYCDYYKKYNIRMDLFYYLYPEYIKKIDEEHFKQYMMCIFCHKDIFYRIVEECILPCVNRINYCIINNLIEKKWITRGTIAHTIDMVITHYLDNIYPDNKLFNYNDNYWIKTKVRTN